MKNKHTEDIDILEELLEGRKETSFPKGSVVMRPEEEIKYIYYLKSGWVRQYAISEEGEELTLNIYRPGSYFSIVLSFNQNNNYHYFEAMTKITTIRIAKKDFLDFIEKNPEVTLDLSKRISRGLLSMMSRMESLVFGTAINKVSANLYLNAIRFDKEKDGSVLIKFPLTHRQIATLSGLTRETVSIVMMTLKKQKIISYSRQEVIILDMDLLQEMSSLSR